eukprot:jgi/Bigna1/71562/fgenesh1_pg.16_\
MMADIGRVVDLQKYPITSLNTDRGRKFIKECREKLQKTGSLSLPGFVRSGEVTRMADELRALEGSAHHRLEKLPVFRKEDGYNAENYSEPGHPTKKQLVQDVRALAADLIPQKSLIKQVYDSKHVHHFLSQVMGTEKLYPFADEFQSLNIMYIRDGGNRAWHYDGSDGVVTLLLQQCDEGGEFEWAPFIREKGPLGQRDEAFDDVKKLFNGQYKTYKTRVAAGTLNIFNGERSMHRVRTVYGGKTRIIAVLSYDTAKGKTSNPAKNVKLYGKRVEAIYKRRGTPIRSKI